MHTHCCQSIILCLLHVISQSLVTICLLADAKSSTVEESLYLFGCEMGPRKADLEIKPQSDVEI